jgi:hypothetical protein
MTSLGYSEFNGSGSGGSSGIGTTGSDGYIASKRKNKTVKAIDGFTSGSNSNTSNNSGSSSSERVNPKLERLKESIAKIHAASSSDDEEDDTSSPSSTNALPTYPGQPVPVAVAGPNANLKISPPIADAGSQLPPTTSDGRTHQPMFSMSQQFGKKSGSTPAGVEQFKMNAPSTYASQYYKQFAPYNYNQLSNELSGPGANEEFIEKLNYIIHMLEEHHNERTEHVTEELVLYCFLGVFIIFIVDSFARAGKYTR